MPRAWTLSAAVSTALTPPFENGGCVQETLENRMQNWLFRILSYLAMLLTPQAPMQVQAQNTEDILAAEKGVTSEGGREASWYLEQHQRLSNAIAGLKPQTPGKIDAYILVVGLDGDPVFQKESQETANVLARRYQADGRTITLTTASQNGAAQGSPANINIALAAIAKKMDLAEDVLVLYTTSHGAPKVGIVYKDDRKGFGTIAPRRLKTMLSDLGIKRRMIMISACYSGEFVPSLASEDSVVITAASASRTSFGCAPGNDWTFFGDALINHGLRTPKSLQIAATEATGLIAQWEKQFELTPSDPQVSIGANSNIWLKELDSLTPPIASKKVGKPAIESDVMDELKAEIAAKKTAAKNKSK
jgi:hypothetical protein